MDDGLALQIWAATITRGRVQFQSYLSIISELEGKQANGASSAPLSRWVTSQRTRTDWQFSWGTARVRMYFHWSRRQRRKRFRLHPPLSSPTPFPLSLARAPPSTYPPSLLQWHRNFVWYITLARSNCSREETSVAFSPRSCDCLIRCRWGALIPPPQVFHRLHREIFDRDHRWLSRSSHAGWTGKHQHFTDLPPPVPSCASSHLG